MKKLVLFIVAVVITAVSAKTFAQSTGTTPAPGATHSYFITPGSSTNNISWTITKGTLTDTTDAGVITVITPDSISIQWADTVSVDDWYYVHVTETDGDGCTNNKILPVEISESPFYLTLASSKTDQCYDGAVSASIDISDPSVVKYVHGTATLEFTVTPSGLSDSYDGYSFDLAIDYNSYAGTLSESIDVTSGNGSVSGTTITVDDNEAVTFTYTVNNANEFTNTTDLDGDAADYTATVTVSSGKASNGVSDNGTGQKADATNVARPHTSGIGTN